MIQYLKILEQNTRRIQKKGLSYIIYIYYHLCTQYLVGAPFAWITASMRRNLLLVRKRKSPSDGNILFQQDLTPAHSATTTSYWFADHSITVLDWLANSSDLNPIDNLWGIVKMNMRDAKTVKELEVLRMLGR